MNTRRLFYAYVFIYVIFLSVEYLLAAKNDIVLFGVNFLGMFFAMFFFLVEEARYDKTLFSMWVKPSNLLLLSLLIVNLQIIISVWLGYEGISTYLGTDKYSGYIGKVLYLSLVGISAYLVGYSFCHGKTGTKSVGRNNLYISFWCLLTLVCFILFLKNIDLISFLTGMDYDGSGAADRETTSYAIWETLFDSFMTIALACITKKCIGENRTITIIGFIKQFPLYYLLPVIIYVSLRLISGDRGPVIYTLLMFFYSYLLITQKRIKLWVIIVLILVGALSMTVLNSVRSFRNPNQSFSEKVVRAITEKDEINSVRSICPLTYELSKSVNCNFIAVHDINEGVTDYKWGVYNLCELLSSIPGSNRVTNSLFGLNLYRTTTSEYVTVSFLGQDYLYGLGTTAITDLYLDFGLLGVLLGFFLIGVTYRKVDQAMAGCANSVLSLIVFLKFASMAIYMPRASYSFVVCKIIYIIILYLIFRTIFSAFELFKKAIAVR